MMIQRRDPADASASTAAVVDVLLPVFNAEATLEAAVRSIQNQSISNIRIIIVDDGSTDRSPAILARLAAQDPRIELITKTNSGIVDALNEGLQRCSADYVARHDADDIAYRDRFSAQIAYLERHPQCVAVDGDHHVIDDEGRIIGRHVQQEGPVPSNARSIPSRQPYLTHPFLMVRRAALLEAGGYRHALHAEDTDLYWRLLPLGELHHVPAMLGAYRLHAGSLSSASVLNGRIAAAQSQLAALAYRSRSSGQPEPTISRKRSAAMLAAKTLSAIVLEATQGLAEDDRRWLTVSTCAHMLEIGAYRPWTLADEDVAYIYQTIASHADLMIGFERLAVDRNVASMAMKLVAEGRVRTAFRLHPAARLLAMAALKRLKRTAFARLSAHQTIAAPGSMLLSNITPDREVTPRVDVIISAHNAARTLEEAVHSIQNQTVHDIRIIIVDDGSTDGTAALLATLADSDERIIIVSKAHSGVEDSRNLGFDYGNAPLVAVFDADDISFPNRLQTQIAYLDAHPACLAVDGSHVTINAAGREIGRHIQTEGLVVGDATAVPSRQPYLTHTLLMVRREAMARVGGYRHATRSLDTDLYWRLSEIGELRHLPSVVGAYRMHDASVSSVGIRNGRLAAITSQLAALGHLRRRNGQPDIIFSRELSSALLAQPTLTAMVLRAGQGLDEHERKWLNRAVAAHLLELVAFRPYLLEASDIDFVRHHLIEQRSFISAEDWRAITGNIATVAAKLVLAGQLAFALKLRPRPPLVSTRFVQLIKRRWVNPLVASLKPRSRAWLR